MTQLVNKYGAAFPCYVFSDIVRVGSYILLSIWQSYKLFVTKLKKCNFSLKIFSSFISVKCVVNLVEFSLYLLTYTMQRLVYRKLCVCLKCFRILWLFPCAVSAPNGILSYSNGGSQINILIFYYSSIVRITF